MKSRGSGKAPWERRLQTCASPKITLEKLSAKVCGAESPVQSQAAWMGSLLLHSPAPPLMVCSSLQTGLHTPLSAIPKPLELCTPEGLFFFF